MDFFTVHLSIIDVDPLEARAWWAQRVGGLHRLRQQQREGGGGHFLFKWRSQWFLTGASLGPGMGHVFKNCIAASPLQVFFRQKNEHSLLGIPHNKKIELEMHKEQKNVTESNFGAHRFEMIVFLFAAALGSFKTSKSWGTVIPLKTSRNEDGSEILN